ncbi:hypothetical protein Q7P37_002915 [Cladosporium fusiforme]
MPTLPTTEVAVIPLIAGTSIMDPGSHGAAVMQDVITTLRSLVGFQAIQFGTYLEEPDSLQLLVDWDSRQDHERFMESAAYEPVLNRLSDIMHVSHAKFCHVDFEPAGSLSRAISAPITEIVTFYYDYSPDADWLTTAAEAEKRLGKELKSPGYMNIAYGITHEEVEYMSIKGKAALLMLGWESEDTRMSSRETTAFKQSIELLSDGAKAIEAHCLVMI